MRLTRNLRALSDGFQRCAKHRSGTRKNYGCPSPNRDPRPPESSRSASTLTLRYFERVSRPSVAHAHGHLALQGLLE